MHHIPNPLLNEEEKELLNAAPEECFHRAVERGAIPLERVTVGLSPRVANLVRSIATGERAPGAPLESPVTRSFPGHPAGPPDDPRAERMRELLSGFPQLTTALEDRRLTAEEAMEAAHAIDGMLGRYLTGTRYAAP